MRQENSHWIFDCINMDKIKNLSWKQKNRLLLIGLLIGCWIIYSFAIANTLAAKSACEQIQLQLDSSAGAPEQIEQLTAELLRLNAFTGSAEKVNTDSAVHEQILDLLTEYCQANHLELREFLLPITYRQQEWLVETHPFTVEGNFNAIVQLLDYLRMHVPGKVVSADIHSKKDNKTKTTSLLVTIYVQSISTPFT
jgi:hypothetical protein